MQDSELQRKMSGRHLAKLRLQLVERERKKSEGELPRHEIPREPPLSPSSRARAEEERIHKLYPIVIIFLLFFHYFIITILYFNFILVTGLFS
jgi:hypothetical protein